MTRLKNIFTFIVLISLLACEPTVTFNEPQPTDTDNLLKFPKPIQGQYLSLADNSILTIDDKIIQRTYDYDFKVHINQLDSNYRISGDTLISINDNEKKIVKREGDTLSEHIHSVDTLFQINYDNVVRKFKGFYFLNIRYDKESWGVQKINISHGQLLISSISTELDLENLKAITETPQDTISTYKFTATKKQFKKFIKDKGFSETETFVKIRKYSY